MKKVLLILPLIILVVGSSGAAFYFYKKLQETKIGGEEDLIAQVSQIMVLPEEKPTLATVTDPDRLKDQPFFAKAETGDKVLIYTNSQRAILYRPELKKIVDVTSLNINK